MVNRARERREAYTQETQENRLRIAPSVAASVVGFATLHSTGPAHNGPAAPKA